MAIQTRKFVEADLGQLAKLLNETYNDSYEFAPFIEQKLLSWIREARLEVLIAEADGKFLGSAAYSDGHWGEEIVWLSARGILNRKLIEKVLVEQAERLVVKGAVFVAVDAGSPKIGEWIERGYKEENGLYHMVARLDVTKPVPAIPENVVLRSLRVDEEKEFVQTVNAGFSSERLKTGCIGKWKAENPPFNEDWVQIAEAEGKIVSAVVAKPDTYNGESFKGKRGYLGPATTLQDYRGKSLASALTRRAMNFLFENDMQSVALYTGEQNVASVALLKRLGFEVGHHWKFMRRVLPQKARD